MSRPALQVSLLCLLATPLTACRYAFVPLVQAPVEVAMPVRVTTVTLLRSGTSLALQAQVDGRFEPGYLSVQWFDGSRSLGQDSVYLDTAQRRATFGLEAPQKGAYRAVLSFGGAVLRQAELYEVQP